MFTEIIGINVDCSIDKPYLITIWLSLILTTTFGPNEDLFGPIKDLSGPIKALFDPRVVGYRFSPLKSACVLLDFCFKAQARSTKYKVY